MVASPYAPSAKRHTCAPQGCSRTDRSAESARHRNTRPTAGAHQGAIAIARLTKHDVETLLASYDADPIGALSSALGKVLDATPGTPWADLVYSAPLDPETRAGLTAGDVAVLDELARLLNELRGLA